MQAEQSRLIIVVVELITYFQAEADVSPNSRVSLTSTLRAEVYRVSVLSIRGRDSLVTI